MSSTVFASPVPKFHGKVSRAFVSSSEQQGSGAPGLIKRKLTVGRHEATTKPKRGMAALHIFPCAADAESGWCLKA